ncbi:bcl-2-like protein 12 isoform X2 [Emydura macquarii macquarii]|uniref:bcl-2-like protein 12 isoform X2 n=1 Tax=Emydura macquarii macquarii TaxID=1129001 RepID=UPI003529FB95
MAGHPQQRRLQEETRLVLEAFLQGALDRQLPPGHVGRSYHDPHCYAHRHPTEPAAEPGGAPRPGGPWTPLHEEINRVEERKHGFKTSMKRLLQRRPSPRRAPPSPPPPGAEPLKKPKEAGEGRRKHGRAFSIKAMLRKKGSPREETEPPTSPSAPPNSLPVTPCYCTAPPMAQPDPRPLGQADGDSEFYVRVAQKLDRLVKQELSSPPGVQSPLSLQPGAVPPALPGPAWGAASETQAEQVIRRLVALLEEQAGVINEEIAADPLLRSSLSRMSYRSFSRLAEAYTARAAPGSPSPSPQLTRLALTMELTRKVAGINSHAVQTLMGYSLQYMDMFVPWLQQQGGWESIVGQEGVLDVQLD